jgi:protein-tyrosine phosphatase
VYASTDPAVHVRQSRKVAVSPDGTASVTGLDPVSRWYFRITADSAPSGVETAPRLLHLDGVANARDLGGYPAAGGLHIRYGTVFRSARLTTAAAEGRDELAALRLTDDVDFRSTAEAQAEGRPPDTAEHG